MTKNRIFCSHCLRVTGRWHSLLGRLNICSPPPGPIDVAALQAAFKARDRVVNAACAYRDGGMADDAPGKWRELYESVDDLRAMTAAANGNRHG